MTESSSATSATVCPIGADRVARVRDRRDAVLAVAADGRPQPGAAATAPPGSGPSRRCRCRDHLAPGGRRSRRPCRSSCRPRCACRSYGLRRSDRLGGEESLVVAGDPEGELVHVRLAENDRARVHELLHGRRAFSFRTKPRRAGVPAVFGRPATCVLSFTTSGTPCSVLSDLRATDVGVGTARRGHRAGAIQNDVRVRARDSRRRARCTPGSARRSSPCPSRIRVAASVRLSCVRSAGRGGMVTQPGGGEHGDQDRDGGTHTHDRLLHLGVTSAGRGRFTASCSAARARATGTRPGSRAGPRRPT